MLATRNYYYFFKDNFGNMDHTLEKQFSKIENDTKLLFDKINNIIVSITKNKSSNDIVFNNHDKELMINSLFIMMKRIPKTMDPLYEELNDSLI